MLGLSKWYVRVSIIVNQVYQRRMDILIRFSNIKQDDLPVNYKKSSNIHVRPRRVSDKDKKKRHMEAIKKWQNKEYKCPNCDKTIKNKSKYSHNKRCE